VQLISFTGVLMSHKFSAPITLITCIAPLFLSGCATTITKAMVDGMSEVIEATAELDQKVNARMEEAQKKKAEAAREKRIQKAHEDEQRAIKANKLGKLQVFRTVDTPIPPFKYGESYVAFRADSDSFTGGEMVVEIRDMKPGIKNAQGQPVIRYDKYYEGVIAIPGQKDLFLLPIPPGKYSIKSRFKQDGIPRQIVYGVNVQHQAIGHHAEFNIKPNVVNYIGNYNLNKDAPDWGEGKGSCIRLSQDKDVVLQELKDMTGADDISLELNPIVLETGGLGRRLSGEHITCENDRYIGMEDHHYPPFDECSDIICVPAGEIYTYKED
jgi:outer membrane murein-binding lipoprotein Lpp